MKQTFKKEADLGFLFLCALALVGCASIDSSDYRQTVLVTSNPPGAAIYQHGEKLGVTPAFVRVSRQHHPELGLEYFDKAKKQVDLTTHYRWLDSFGMNLLVLQMAPIGWLVDWSTGTAWRMDDPKEIVFNVKHEHEIAKSYSVAIAPPVINNLDVADALGSVLENKLKGPFKVIPYEKTSALFSYYGSDQGLTENKTQRYNLFFELPAEQILVSKAEPKGDGYLVTAHLKNKFTDKDTGEYSWEITPAEGGLKEEFSTHRVFDQYFHLLPNTAFLTFSQYQSTVQVNQQEFAGKARGGQGLGDQFLNYINAISLAHLTRPRSNVMGHWIFEFVPTVNLSRKRIYFPDYKPLQDVDFDRWYISGGYGIEVGHLSRIGLFYLDVIPTVTWTQLHFETPDFEERLSRTSVTYTTELGYSHFFTSHFVGKIFVRNLTEDLYLWQKAIRDVTGHEDSLSSVSSVFTGISLGYYIPSSLTQRGGWKVIEHK